jgi:diguanylate cyclase (GGDEF)-like protein
VAPESATAASPLPGSSEMALDSDGVLRADSADAGPITDAVTGALPRGELQGRLDAAVTDAQRANGCCSVFLFDVDHFKTVNDAYGHARGDDVLRQVAERVMALVRAQDVLVRYGGDEFVLVLPGARRSDAMRAAIRLVDGVNGEPFPGNPPLSVSISLGVATFPDDGADAEALLATADRRNYLAKRRGRARAVGDNLAAESHAGSGRLLEREAALTAAQNFLLGVVAQGRGALRVTGERGAGHTRFLAEVTKLASLRGFQVYDLARGGQYQPDPQPDAPVLVVADTDDDWTAATHLVHRLATAARPPAVLALVHATHEPAGKPLSLPLVRTIILAPLSAASLQVWLRTVLRGEPSSELVDWLTRRSAGLIARAERQLSRLHDRGRLEQGPDGGWTLPAEVLAQETRHGLPTAFSTLIGRERDIRHVVDAANRHRLVTLVGPGGIGKTRLVLAAADVLADDFDDGAVFVPLAEATGIDLVVAAVAQALALAEAAAEPLVETVIRHLAERDVLIVLDNFEQVLVAAPFVVDLLAAAPAVRVLVTSRERLRLSGEHVYPVKPLVLPDLHHLPGRAEDVVAMVATSPALALFVERARQAAYDLHFTPAQAAAAAAVCHQLDGLPLAIELAAARCDTLRPVDLLDQLTAKLDLLTDGPLDLPPRQRTLQATIEWSYALLNPTDQALLAGLGAFTGGCTLPAVQAVCATDDAAGAGADAPAVADRLLALVDKNLLTTRGAATGETRYTMLETIRAFAVQKLADLDPNGQVAARHGGYFAGLVAGLGRDLDDGNTASAVTRYEADHGNILEALNWAVTRGEPDIATEITLSSSNFWRNASRIREGHRWIDRVLAMTPPVADEQRSVILSDAAWFMISQGEPELARSYAVESLALARRTGDRPAITAALNSLGIVVKILGEYDLARAYHCEEMELDRRAGDLKGAGCALGNLAIMETFLGNLDLARSLVEQAITMYRADGRDDYATLALADLAKVYVLQGDSTGARTLAEEALAFARTRGDMFAYGQSMLCLGHAAVLDGDRVTAAERYADALAAHQEAGDLEYLAEDLETAAGFLPDGHGVLAAELFGRAEALREKQRLDMAPVLRPGWQAAVDRARSALGDKTFEAARMRGWDAALDQIVARTVIALRELVALSGDLPT